MKKDKKEVAHRFHFVVNEEMHNDLVELSTRYDMSISGLIKYIMAVCNKFLEEKHFTGIEQEFNSVVAWSKEIQVYFDDSNIGLFRSLSLAEWTLASLPTVRVSTCMRHVLCLSFVGYVTKRMLEMAVLPRMAKNCPKQGIVG